MTYLVVKALHIIFMVTWFAGLFYLPRLFVYHAMSEDGASIERFKVMERKLYWGIMAPGAVLTIGFGTWLWLGWFRGAGGWLHAKLALVFGLFAVHGMMSGWLRNGAISAERIVGTACSGISSLRTSGLSFCVFAGACSAGTRVSAAATQKWMLILACNVFENGPA